MTIGAEMAAPGPNGHGSPDIEQLFGDIVQADSGVRMRVAAGQAFGPPKAVVRLGYDLARQIDQTLAALAEHGPKHGAQVFRRGDAIVRVVRRNAVPDRSGILSRTSESFAIIVLDGPSMTDLLTRPLEFERYDGRRAGWVKIIPPRDLVQGVLRRRDWEALPNLTGVSEVPFLRSDGTVCQTPGYDAATGYLYQPSGEFPVIAETPSRADVDAAVTTLRSVVHDFPFAQPAHESAWLAFLLTLFARPAIAGNVPLMAIDATTPGTGKGKLVDVTSAITTGHIAPKSSLPETEEEFKKCITSIVQAARPLAVIDNVTRTIKSGSLDALLTSETWDDRVLGRTEQVSWPNRCVWCTTGNNLQFGADTSRRTLHIRLESRRERPQDRDDFAHDDLIAHVLKERPKLVAAALTILRGYFATGAPRMGCPAWGSFESWSRIIANCCVWAGMPDPQDTRAELAAVADTTAASLAVLIEGWAKLDRTGQGLTAKAALNLLYPPSFGREARPPDGFDDMREALEQLAPPSPGRPPASAQVGYALRRFRRRVIGGRMFDNVISHGHIARWRVISCSPGGRDPGPPSIEPPPTASVGLVEDVQISIPVPCQPLLPRQQTAIPPASQHPSPPPATQEKPAQVGDGGDGGDGEEERGGRDSLYMGGSLGRSLTPIPTTDPDSFASYVSGECLDESLADGGIDPPDET